MNADELPPTHVPSPLRIPMRNPRNPLVREADKLEELRLRLVEDVGVTGDRKNLEAALKRAGADWVMDTVFLASGPPTSRQDIVKLRGALAVAEEKYQAIVLSRCSR